MPVNSPRTKLGDWPALGILALLAAATRLSIGPLPIDDAYISFRYARNVVEGVGLVYNPGQAVLGTSTPLFTLLLSGLSALQPNIQLPVLALWVNSVADALTCMLVVLLGKCIGMRKSLALAAGIAVAVSPVMIRYAIGGMELPLVSLLSLAAFLAFVVGRPLLAANFAGAAFLARPDALLVGAVILLAITWLRRRPDWKAAGVLGLWVLPLVLTLWIAYGHPVPQSVIAKSHSVYRIEPFENLRQALLSFGGVLLAGPLGLRAEGFWIVAGPLAAILVSFAVIPQLLLWLKGAGEAQRSNPRTIVLPVHAAMLLFIYSALGIRGSPAAEWYFLPMLPTAILLTLRGAEALPRRDWRTPLGSLAAVLMVASQLLGLNLGRDPSRRILEPLGAWSEREELYREAAAFLDPRIMSGDWVAASEIGALGYYCACQILDTVGLVSPEVLAYYPLTADAYVVNYAIPEQLMQARRPEYLVSLEVMMRNTLLQDEWFLSNYQVIWQAETDAFGSRGLQIYARSDLGPQ